MIYYIIDWILTVYLIMSNINFSTNFDTKHSILATKNYLHLFFKTPLQWNLSIAATIRTWQKWLFSYNIIFPLPIPYHLPPNWSKNHGERLATSRTKKIYITCISYLCILMWGGNNEHTLIKGRKVFNLSVAYNLCLRLEVRLLHHSSDHCSRVKSKPFVFRL